METAGLDLGFRQFSVGTGIKDHLVVDADDAGIRKLQEIQTAKKGGFSAPRGPDDRQCMTFIQGKGDIGQNLGTAEGFLKVFNLQNGHFSSSFYLK